jgi:amidohydrolase
MFICPRYKYFFLRSFKMITLSACENKYGTLLKTIKSDLHRHPELSMQEYRTTTIVRNQLASLGIEIMDLGLETGVVGILQGAKKGPIIALRADLDALPVTECSNDNDASSEEGKMHACGHDVHTTSLLGAAMLLGEQREDMSGSIVFVFQPAEETAQGAKKMIEAGLFERIAIDAMFGLHVRPEIEVGRVGIKAGALMSAKDSFSVTVSGKGGHGSAPQNTVDPLVAGAALLTDIQSIISRNIDPREAAVISVCSIHAGTADNIIPDKLIMQGSMRTFSRKMRDFLIKRLEEVAYGVAMTYGCTAEVKIFQSTSTPVLINDPAMTAIAMRSAIQALGKECLSEQEKEMGSEDFAEFGNHVPIFFYFIGSGTPGRDYYPWHSPNFHADERTPMIGAALLACTALNAQQTLEK